MIASVVEPRGLPPAAFTILYFPGGLATGFVTVTLSYILAHHGVSIAAIASLVSISLLPHACRFLMGPLVDTSLSCVKWFLICDAIIMAGMVAMALAPMSNGSMPFLDTASLILGVAGCAASSSITAAMARTMPNEQRGAVAGWQQAGNLGGAGVGGGAGLWLAVHAGGALSAAAILAGVCFLCAAPLLWMRVPRAFRHAEMQGRVAEVGLSLWTLLRSRRGVLVSLMVVMPAALGAASNLFAAVAADWRASADLVAVVTGVCGGVVTILGCVAGGYLCDRAPRRTVYILASVACSLGEAAMALTPHTPVWFGAMILGNGFLLGIAWAAVSAVIFECLGTSGAATVASVLTSLACLPVVVMTAVVGRVQTTYGSTAMLLAEAIVAVVSIAAYAALDILWRPSPEFDAGAVVLVER